MRALSLSRVSSSACLMRRFVSLCLGGYSDEFGTCVDAPALENGGFALFLDRAYHELTWAHWMVAHAAVLEASYALYVDADVVLLANPFTHINGPRASLLYAEELGNCNKARGHLSPCSSNPCKLNAGFFLVSSSELTYDILTQVYPKTFHHTLQLDQDLVVSWIRSARRPAANHTFCRLPPTFAGHCGNTLGLKNPQPCDLVTFHATCLKNATKLPHMKEMLRATAKCSERSAQKRSSLSGHCCRRDGHGSPRLDKIRNVSSWLGCATLCKKHASCHYHSYSLQTRQCFLCAQCDLYLGGSYTSSRLPSRPYINPDMGTYGTYPASLVRLVTSSPLPSDRSRSAALRW